jgi:hypothetical protein
MFGRDDRIHIPHPEKNLQLKMLRSLPTGSEFVAYIDAIGKLDGQRFLIDWKTTSSRYPEEPDGLLSLDPQLICYSWASGIRDVALVVFVRKRVPEIQYLKASITDEQREEFDRLVHSTASQIEAGQFLPEPWEILYFKVFKSELPVIEQAMETASLMLGGSKSRGYCLEMICADFLAGANLENPDPSTLSSLVRRFFEFLPATHKRELLGAMRECA